MFELAALSLGGKVFIFQAVAADKVFVEALDDFGDKHSGFHVGVEEFLVGVVEDAGVFAFDGVNHFDNDVAWRKNLAGALRRNEVENIFIVGAGEVVGEYVLAAEKFHNDAVEN